MLGAFGLGQFERWAVERLAGCRVMQHALGVVAADQAAVPDPFWIERDIWPEIALAKARIAQQTCAWLVLEQLDQTSA